MEHIKTVVQEVKKSEKRIFYNIEEFCNAFNIPMEFWNKSYDRYKKYVGGQKRLGWFGYYDFLFANQYYEIIHGASGEHRKLYCTKALIQEVLRLEMEEVY